MERYKTIEEMKPKMSETKKNGIIGPVALRLGLYALAVFISFPLSTWSYLLYFFPLITTVIALIFVIKIFMDGRRGYCGENQKLGIAYYITAGIIVLLQTGVILGYWMMISNALRDWR